MAKLEWGNSGDTGQSVILGAVSVWVRLPAPISGHPGSLWGTRVCCDSSDEQTECEGSEMALEAPFLSSPSTNPGAAEWPCLAQ